MIQHGESSVDQSLKMDKCTNGDNYDDLGGSGDDDDDDDFVDDDADCALL